MAGRRFDVFLVNLDPTVGSEIRKTRPCVIVSPDEMNDRTRTVIVLPLTTGGHVYVTRVPCRAAGRAGFVVVDQPRSVDVSRLIRRLGALTAAEGSLVLEALERMFAP